LEFCYGAQSAQGRAGLRTNFAASFERGMSFLPISAIGLGAGQWNSRAMPTSSIISLRADSKR
jgi:hypothetical protein